MNSAKIHFYMKQKDNSVHQALAHLDRVKQFITTLRQLGDNEVAIAAVCKDELAHLTNTLTPTLLVRTVKCDRGSTSSDSETRQLVHA